MRTLFQGQESAKRKEKDGVGMVPPRPSKKMEDVLTHDYDVNNKMQAKIYTDQTGNLPVRSSHGHQYIMVLVNMDSSYRSMEPMKNRHLSEIIKTYQVLIDRLKQCGIIPVFYERSNNND